MGNADALSRLPLHKPTKISEEFINFCSVVGEMSIDQFELEEATMKDPILKRIVHMFKLIFGLISWKTVLSVNLKKGKSN